MSSSPQLPLSLPRRSLLLPAGLVLFGAGAAIYGLSAAPERTWPNLLLNGVYITSLALSALFFLTTQRLTGARWSANLRRIPEAMALALPFVAPLVLLTFLGRQTVFPWSRPGAFDHVPAFAGKIAYLQTPRVFTRTVIVLVSWVVFAILFRRASVQQDRKPEMNLALHERMVRYAVWFVMCFTLTFSLGAYDWLLSLEPMWSSTMFVFYVFAGTFVQGIAAVTLATVLLKRGPLQAVVSEHQLHDLGKMLFAFSTFWAYIWTAQYLLIWYGNIPEEVSHFLKRTNGPWLYLFALNFLINWVVPFIALLSVRAKRSIKTLRNISILLLLGHWLDLYMLIMPASWEAPRLGVLEILIAAGYIAFVYSLTVWALGRAPLVPLHDPVVVFEELPHAAVHPERGDLLGAKQ